MELISVSAIGDHLENGARETLGAKKHPPGGQREQGGALEVCNQAGLNALLAGRDAARF
jgi:hypothetical protein